MQIHEDEYASESARLHGPIGAPDRIARRNHSARTIADRTDAGNFSETPGKCRLKCSRRREEADAWIRVTGRLRLLFVPARLRLLYLPSPSPSSENHAIQVR